MANELGSRHSLGVRPQTVEGTPETSVGIFLPTHSLQMSANPQHLKRKSFNATGRSLPSRKGYIKPGGKAPMDIMASLPHPWYYAMGNVATTNPTGTVQLHTITDNDSGDLTEPIPLTLEGDRVFDQCRQGDARINKIKHSGQAGEQGHEEIEWLALSHVDGDTLVSVAAFVDDALTLVSATIEIDDVARLDIPSIEFEYDNDLEQLPVIEDAEGAPQRIRRKGGDEGAVKVSGKFKFLDVLPAELTKYREATSFKLVLEYIGDVISGEYRKFRRYTFPACQFTGGFDDEAGGEALTTDPTFEAHYDTTTGTGPLIVEAQNTIADITGFGPVS